MIAKMQIVGSLLRIRWEMFNFSLKEYHSLSFMKENPGPCVFYIDSRLNIQPFSCSRVLFVSKGDRYNDILYIAWISPDHGATIILTIHVYTCLPISPTHGNMLVVYYIDQRLINPIYLNRRGGVDTSTIVIRLDCGIVRSSC